MQSRSVASEVERLCGCLNGIIRGAQKCPLPPESCFQLQCIWPLLLRYYFHQAGTEMQICDITAVIITLTWMNLPNEQESDGGGGMSILKIYFVFLVWRNEKVLEYRAAV